MQIKNGNKNWSVNDVRCTTENIVSDVDELMLLPMRVSFNFMFFSALMRSQFVFLFIFAAVTSNCVYFVTVSKAELSFIRMQTLHLHWNKLMNRMLTRTHTSIVSFATDAVGKNKMKLQTKITNKTDRGECNSQYALRWHHAQNSKIQIPNHFQETHFSLHICSNEAKTEKPQKKRSIESNLMDD